MRVQINPKVVKLPRLEELRLFLIKTNLKLLNRLGRLWTTPDQKINKYQVVNCAGLEILISETVSNPAPLPGLHFVTLFKSSAAHVSQEARVLEMGAGAGVWSLLCAKRGAQVTASDLVGVDLSGLEKSAHQIGKSIEIYNGDLFEKLNNQRFDHIFFNPPFHHAPAKNIREQAYFGGDKGKVVSRFLQESPKYLNQNGQVWLILPKHEAQLHQEALDQWLVSEVQSIYLPLLGTVKLLALSPKLHSGLALPTSRPMNPLSECFYQLSKVMNTHSCELLTIKGAIEVDLLDQALNLALDQNLLTRSLLTAEKELKSYTLSRSWRWVSQHPRPKTKLHLENLSLEEEQSISDCLNEQIQWHRQLPPSILERIWSRSALNPHQVSPFEFHLLKGRSLSFFLIISPHLSTDAFAGTHLLNQIANQYQTLIDSDLEPNPETQLIQKQDLKSSSQKLSQAQYHSNSDHLSRQAREIDPLESGTLQLTFLNRCLTYAKAFKGIVEDLFQDSEGLKIAQVHHELRGNTQVLIKRISKLELKSVLQGARARKVKAHTLFSWGLAQAIKDWSGQRNLPRKRHLRLADLCTLRPLLETSFQDEIDMLVQPYTHTIDLEWSETEALEQISKHLQTLKRGGVTTDLFRSQIYRMASRYISLEKMMHFTFKRLFKTNITTTNPGPAPLKFTQFGEAQVLDFINFPQIAPPADLGIIYTTYNGELRIVTLYDENRWQAEELNELIELLWNKVCQLAHVSQASSNNAD